MSKKNLKMKIVLATGLLALAFAPGMAIAQDSAKTQAPTEAQDKSQAAPAAAATSAKPAMRHRGVMQGLSLTADQRTAMKKIHETTRSQIESVKQDTTLTADQQAAKIHELRRDSRTQVVKLLTPDQRQQMRANIRALRAARREQRLRQQQSQAQPQG
ncbi:MAG TPA: hypothetical protein VJN93_14115 [Candidatus Acidoferrum sp.]|nr:hypothetical protein [Candidatus Acidoferrum sp.]